MKAPKERGRALVEALVGVLASPDSPVADPTPLTDEALRAAEASAGVALSPTMHALLALDHTWVERELGWFHGGVFAATSAAQLIEAWAGELWPAYTSLVNARFPARALPLQRSQDTFSLLYLGDPDEQGEYPVLELDQDDVPVMGVAAAGFDVWLGRRLGLLGPRAFATEQKATAKRLWNRQSDLGLDDVPKRLPEPVAGPAPGTVHHTPVVASAPKKKARKLSDTQLSNALLAAAEQGAVRRLAELVPDAQGRGLGPAPLDAALCAAAHHDRPEAVALLLEAGANPNARDRYGCALARAMWCADDQVHDLLLARGANPNGPDVNGKTALHAAVARGRTSLVAKLLAAGASLARRDAYGHTPLHTAVSISHPDPLPPLAILELLLGAGVVEDGKVPLLPYARANAPNEYVALISRALGAHGPAGPGGASS
ncbi:MAG: ankyrin repeat domain-containing protein [Polyangiales bacterium]|nr:ankyrin repeat domain-containing protein [Sandaracinaceae bacterium]